MRLIPGGVVVLATIAATVAGFGWGAALFVLLAVVTTAISVAYAAHHEAERERAVMMMRAQRALDVVRRDGYVSGREDTRDEV